MPRWKMKVGLTDGGKNNRDIAVVLAKYGDDMMPIERHVVSFEESDTNQNVAAMLRLLADQIAPESQS